MLLHDHTHPYLGGCNSEPCMAHVLRVHTTAHLSFFLMYLFVSEAPFAEVLLYCMVKMITVAVNLNLSCIMNMTVNF